MNQGLVLITPDPASAPKIKAPWATNISLESSFKQGNEYAVQMAFTRRNRSRIEKIAPDLRTDFSQIVLPRDTMAAYYTVQQNSAGARQKILSRLSHTQNGCRSPGYLQYVEKYQFQHGRNHFFSKGLMHGMVVVTLAGFFLVTVIIGQSLGEALEFLN